MSHSESAGRAIGWLEQQVAELTGIRNATARDPSFKNWRQNTLTVMQRIWPGDQARTERFRRIPFSPADPRSDMRTQREWYSRGCQEAARVLNRMIEDVRAQGVPELAEDVPIVAPSEDFQDDFPTVELPEGEVGEPSPPGQGPAAGPRPRKGLGVAARLRDLLEFAGLSAKAAASPPREAPPPPPASDRAEASAAPELGILPVGEEITPLPPAAAAPPSPAPTWPTPQASVPTPPPSPPAPPAQASESSSVTMSRPTTLRTSIEKVTIESLISKEFRAGAQAGETRSPEGVAPEAPPAAKPATSAAAPSTPASPSAATAGASAQPPAPAAPPRTAARPMPARRAPRPNAPASRAPAPPLSLVPPLSADPEFNVDPAPPPAPPATKDAAATAAARERSSGAPDPVPAASSEAPSDAPSPTPAGARQTPDSEELARATENFLRSSPVLGATGRKVQRHHDETGFQEPDAIAVAAMADDVGPLGVPLARQIETRARLIDLARRLEQGQIEWAVLRRAVWFAMEYPEVARRLMPVLLPWFDRAA